MIKNYSLIIWGLMCMFSLSCRKDADELNPGNIGNSKIVFIDTCTVQISTVLIDSLATSSASRMISGSYTDPHIGKVSASCYFQLSLAGIDKDHNGLEDIVDQGQPVYDSLVLILNNNYNYGDITQLHKFTVHKVNQIMAYSANSRLYNSSFFSYDPSPVGSKSFYLQDPLNPEAANPEIRVKLDDDPLFGPDLFNRAKNNEFHITTNDYFKELVKGLVIVPDPSNTSILGYSLNPVMRLYYHDNADPATVKSYDFGLKSFKDIYFNRITNDRSSTNISSLKNNYNEVPSSNSNNESYVLTGINLFTKINFPYLNQVRQMYPNCYISKAFLVIHPKVNTYDKYYSLPNELSLFNTDQTNFPGNIITYKGMDLAQVVNPKVYWATPENTEYTFELTNFVSAELENRLYSRKGLFLGSAAVLSNDRAEKLTLSANDLTNKNIKLVMYLSVFNQ
jgi:hypothetical protein